MVFFTCNACSEALKKNQVEKHTYKCRQCQSLSCVDCGKDFWGSEYLTHTKCITEDEKYCGKGFVAKVNKGEVKQEQWIEKVQGAIEKASSNPKLKGLLERLTDYPNIPRKKAKFENFLKNSLRVLSPALISQVWDLLMTAANNAAESKHNVPSAQSAQTNGETKSNVDPSKTSDGHMEVENENEETAKLNKREKKEERQKKNKKEKKDKEVPESNGDVEKVKKKKKRKHEEVLEDQSNVSEEPVSGKKRKRNEEPAEEDPGSELSPIEKKKKKKKHDSSQEQAENGSCDLQEDAADNDQSIDTSSGKKKKFRWGATITAILEKKGEMPLKKLRRKVLSEFSAQDAANYNEENLTAKFNKKINKMPGVSVLKERVKLK
ncbi:cell growth-regulating nucleolar protein [Aplysia californica]|uniref:Cell growth-regulating nucleolar protein n=1 Tax=Aplysia californica TaxID=6500 RepID=A0ABM0JBH2_APLCA|nr:cell growth-regulating nucleolar protein [Aplysia californica]XP_005089830.1 cell growth-regulating nucleolar protein [Aplysia californica]XP_005089831.1 cell growth-regulating nucleolar protein [Aplysia californica]XP_035825773.1 cell growth-regulating nucleolar protein [Aplysia californica]